MQEVGIAAYNQAQNKSKAVEAYAPLVKRIAQHLIARLPDSVQFDDLLQAGMLGLMEAVGKYDASKGASFETYAGIRIRGAMLDEMRRGDWAPRSVHRNSRRVLSAIKAIEHEKGATASDRDVAQALEISLDEYHDMVRDVASCKLFSYEEILDADDTSALPKSGSSMEPVERGQLLDSISSAIRSLTDREQLVMSLYYEEELNLKEIGAVLNVSESRVSQILSQAVVRIRSRMHEWVDE